MTEITHKGTIISSEENKIKVKISPKEACGSCSLKDACSQNTKTQEIEVVCDNKKKYEIGQEVEVMISSKQAFYAAFYGYVIPLFLMIISLFLTFFITRNETTSAVMGLAILIPYYILLWIFRNILQKTLTIRVR